jgi:membrane protein required for colicin V production
MNSFDIVVTLALIIVMVAGFRAGLLRSAVTILAYLIAMPVAIWIMALLAPAIGGADAPVTQNSVLFFGVFLATGMALGWLARMALDDAIGPETGFGDRLGGALLGAVRVGVVAITLVLIFDQLVPADRQPAWLVGSQLRPVLSVLGQRGFRSLPPEATAYVERLKHERGI